MDVGPIFQDAIDRLVAEGYTKPSVYLARGNRLRIQAVHGYHQIFDGMPIGVGVIGRCMDQGRTLVVDDVTGHDGYLQANPSVRAEVSTPIRCCDRVIGVLNIESDVALTPEDVARLEAEAARLGEVLEVAELSLGESAAQRLVRHATRLGTLTDPDDLHAEAVAAACDVAEMDTGALLLPAAHGGVLAVAATGPLAETIGLAPTEDVRAIADLVQSGCSSYTIEGTEDTGVELGTLRAAGAEAVVAVPLPGAAGRRGVLLLADRRPLTPPTDTVELLEALAAHVASCLRTASALAELRRRAATDALTGLGHHGTFHEALGRATAQQESVAVIVCDIDGFKAVNDRHGHQAGDRILRETSAALSTALRRGDELFRLGGDEFAAIIRVVDPHEALDVGRRLREAAARSGEVTLSVGVTLVRPGEAVADAVARADAALYEVKASGRDGVALLS